MSRTIDRDDAQPEVSGEAVEVRGFETRAGKAVLVKDGRAGGRAEGCEGEGAGGGKEESGG
jgi:hypothetical protein